MKWFGMAHNGMKTFLQSSEHLSTTAKLAARYPSSGFETLLEAAIEAHHFHTEQLRHLDARHIKHDLPDVEAKASASSQTVAPPLPEPPRRTDWHQDPWGYLKIKDKGRLQPLPRFVPVKK